MNAAFFAAVRSSLFGGSLSQRQVDGISTIWAAWNTWGDGDERKLAYILATAFHETARTMQPVRETLAKSDAKAKEILTKAWKAGKLPWVKRDYWSSGWFGRGYVQLTHEENYRRAGKELGIDLVSNPSRAMEPGTAAAIIVKGMMEGWFTGKKLADYPNDFVNARRIVNGTDRAQQIAQYAQAFLVAIKSSGASTDARKPIPAPQVPEKAKRPSATSAAGLIAILAIVAGIAAKLMGAF